jgi:hypothetical protein
MGGYGSGRWSGYSKKATVEDARTLTMSKLYRDGILKPGSYSLTWTNTTTGEATGSIGYTIHRGLDGDPANHLYMILKYELGKQHESIEEPVRLGATRPTFGGVRHWFTCPLIVEGRPCNRRTGKLHLIGGCKYFGCRHCLNLTYTSRQSHEKRLDLLSKLFKLSPDDSLDGNGRYL